MCRSSNIITKKKTYTTGATTCFNFKGLNTNWVSLTIFFELAFDALCPNARNKLTKISKMLLKKKPVHARNFRF